MTEPQSVAWRSAFAALRASLGEHRRRVVAMIATAVGGLAITLGLLYQSVPIIGPAAADLSRPTVPWFSVANHSPFFAMHDMHWACDFEVPPATKLRFFGAQRGVELTPASSANHQCNGLGVADGQMIAITVHLTFKTMFLRRSATGARLVWKVDHGQGQWVDGASADVLGAMAAERGGSIKLTTGHRP